MKSQEVMSLGEGNDVTGTGEENDITGSDVIR